MHEGLAWLEATEEGRDWLTRLPGIIDMCAQEWSLTLGEPFAYAFASLAMPATRADGSPVVLKVQFTRPRERARGGGVVAHGRRRRRATPRVRPRVAARCCWSVPSRGPRSKS